MTETTIEDNAISKDDQWRDRIAEQERSGLSVKQFCKERGVSEYSFYTWRKRLAKKEPVRFALVNREAAGQEPATALELVLMSGERLRIGNGVNAATLRTVVEALRT
jgi:hypothetical protein